ncbi:ArnT family glycosyltransferase [Roseivirga sp.]|uniref:ArnT family glycosyltransferase n=1 Tax=Roseivirga sp. TaxID=1964215 RepID=UPI003B8CB77B
MKTVSDYLLLRAPHKSQAYFLMAIITAVYLLNFHVNDIWTPNESFYAEAVREMFESGNFLEIFYNYEPRYNKPPLTYWLIAGSSSIFGLNEFGIRLPIVLLGLGSIWITYLLGRLLYGEKGGLYAMVMMAFSIQVLAVKQYASPEIPLTFFFTLTMYYFIKGFMARNKKYILLSYVALGLTVLTKGFPYIIVIAGIIGVFILISGPDKWKRVWKEVKFLNLHIGVPIALLIGLSWVIFMYLKDGQAFWEVYYRETFGRALSKKTNGPKPFFYLEVISWSIIPYSLVFFYAVVRWFGDRKNISRVVFPVAWFAAMLIIFSIAKGKIPTYMIQAHPAMFLMIVPLLLDYQPAAKFWRIVWKTTFALPSILIIAATFYTIYFLDLPVLLYGLGVLSLAGFVLWLKKGNNPDWNVMIPFWSITAFLICFAIYLPRMERFRPYDELGNVINLEQEIDKSIPIQIQKTLIHNIPFYAERFAIRDQTIDDINDRAEELPILALVRDEDFAGLKGFESIWSGMIYDFSSESQFLKFVLACLDAEKGDFSKFAKYHVVTKGID